MSERSAFNVCFHVMQSFILFEISLPLELRAWKIVEEFSDEHITFSKRNLGCCLEHISELYVCRTPD
jgi:hypothetical protein